MNLVSLIDGKKTYISAIGGIVYGLLIALKVTPSESSVWAIIGSAGVIGVRSAASKLINAYGSTVLPVIVRDAKEAINS